MAFKFVTILAFVTMTLAGEIVYDPHHYHPHHQPALVKTYAAPALVKHVEYEAPAKYDFSYGVHDAQTGDIKEQTESRVGDQVHGSYSVVDPDGYKRTVEYTADDHNGFNAVVRREPIAHVHAHPQVVKVAHQPVHQYVQPIAKVNHYAAPQHYVAPQYVQKVHQPVYHHSAPTTYTKVVAPVHQYYHH